MSDLIHRYIHPNFAQDYIHPCQFNFRPAKYIVVLKLIVHRMDGRFGLIDRSCNFILKRSITCNSITILY